MFVPFEKVISLPTLVLGSPVQLVVAERKTRGGSGREAGLVPSTAQPGSVPVSSWLWEYSHFCAKTASTGYPTGAAPLEHPWLCALSLALLGHGPRSPGAGELQGLAAFGVLFLEMQDWGRVWETLGAKLTLKTWEVAAPWAGRE